jgi:sugar diacid utilization regulator
MWTKERIQRLLATDNLAVERAVVAIYDRQTQDEKRDSDTKHDNTVGFRANHAPTMSFYARIILKGWKQDGHKKRAHLNPNKLEKARRFMMQYHRQLAEIANAKEAQKNTRSASSPPAGSWAATARAMAEVMLEFDWDAWKDEMKEGGL